MADPCQSSVLRTDASRRRPGLVRSVAERPSPAYFVALTIGVSWYEAAFQAPF